MFNRVKKEFFVFMSSILLVTSSYAEDSSFQSSYTSIAAQDCSLQDSNPVLDYASQNCKSFSDDIDVKVIEDDARQTLELSRGSQEYRLKLQSLGFSKLGPKIEWRYKKGQPDNIISIIVRLNVSEKSGGMGKIVSYLIVSKITPTDICVVGKVPPLSGGQQNKQARLMAENATQMACLKGNFNANERSQKTIAKDTEQQKKTEDEKEIDKKKITSDYYNQHLTDARVTDSDGDGVNNYDDLCPSVPDPKQEDKDGDQVGDACDACPNEVAQRYSNGCKSSLEATKAKAVDGDDNTKSEGVLKSLLPWKLSN